jgi:hypothetical protein
MIMTALCVAFWATFFLVLVDHISKQCLLYAVGCAIAEVVFSPEKIFAIRPALAKPNAKVFFLHLSPSPEVVAAF